MLPPRDHRAEAAAALRAMSLEAGPPPEGVSASHVRPDELAGVAESLLEQVRALRLRLEESDRDDILAEAYGWAAGGRRTAPSSS